MVAIRWRFIVSSAMTIISGDAARRSFASPSAAFVAPAAPASSHGVSGQPAYTIATVDLSQQWIDLVRQNKVAATVQIPSDDGKSELSVRYGVRLVEKKDKSLVCQEFVEEGEQDGQSSSSAAADLVRSINETLASFQNDDAGGSPVKFELDGDFAAQLQLVRTLRPAPSAGFSGATSAIPPAYDAASDSFVTGPLRLELRPKVGTLSRDGMKTPWDVYHNVSPVDTRGHFLLLPTLADKSKNWRGQQFTNDDCNDMVMLASSVEPVGSLFLAYNSVGAAASQNHIHCHAWPCPPIPLQKRTTSDNADEVVHGWNCYAVSRLKSIYDFVDVQDGNVEVSYLEYPVFCVQLSASEQRLELLGKALAATMEAVGEAPHNIGFLNRLQTDDETSVTERYTDVYVFARSKERSSVLPTLKLGISEMMGVFHAQSEQELEQLRGTQDSDTEGPMYQALSEISFENEAELWESIKSRLENLAA